MPIRTSLAILFCLIGALPASAQSSGTPLSQLLPRLFLDQIRLAPPAPGTTVDHQAHFQNLTPDSLAVPFALNDALVAQLSRLPLGTSSGGFTFTFDEAAGTFTRSTRTFGPAFAERAATVGRGKASLGLSFQRATYDGVEGKSFDDGEVKFYLRHIPCCNGAFFEGDLIEATLDLDLSTSTTTLFGSYGVTDQLEVAVAVPIVSVSMDAAIDARLIRLATVAGDLIHRFPDGSDQARFDLSESSTGFGDLVVRSKYVFGHVEGGGFAAGLDLRLPTGDEENLRGAGSAQATVMLIGSGAYSRYAPHFNIGYTFSGESDSGPVVADEFIYTLGTELEASPRVTINFDVLGRVLRDLGRLEDGEFTQTFRNAAGVTGTRTFEQFRFESGSLGVLTGAVGAKVNLFGNFLLSGNVLFPLKKSGVYDSLTPVIGIDYVF
jgi:hypothetical protein